MKMRRENNLQIFVLLICFFLLLGGCEKQQPQPIKIGLSVNLSGRGGAAGEHIRDGALLAFDYINTQGGINGRSIDILIRDDLNSDEGIRKADESLIDEDVVAIIGHSYSSNTVKAYPIVTSKKTLLITAYTATTKLSGKDDLFIRTSVDCSLYGKKTAALLNRQNISSVAFLMDMTNPAFVVDWIDHVKKDFTGHITEVKLATRENVDWGNVIQQLMASNPDAVFFLTEASMTGVALQKLDQRGFGGKRIATLWTQTPGLMKYGGHAAEGLSIITYIDPDNQRQEYLDFSRKMEERFNKPANARSTRGYEMVMILADALKRCENLNAHSLKKALIDGEYDTLMGTVTFDQFGDVVRPVYEVTVQGGRFKNSGEI